MARISRDNLDYCSKRGECLDCYSQGKDRPSVRFQKRGSLECSAVKHIFVPTGTKLMKQTPGNMPAVPRPKRKAGQCVAPGCHNKLIPHELLPTWWKQEKICGMHGRFKAFRVNRAAIVKFIIERCLGPGLGEGMVAQSIIYHAGEATYCLV